MKRLTFILLALFLLAGCTDQPREEPKIEAVYDSTFIEMDLPQSMSYELAGNGQHTVILPFNNNGDGGESNVHGGTALYEMTTTENKAIGQLIAELERPAELLGMDQADGVWFYDGVIHRMNLNGEEVLRIELPYPLWQNGIFGFADDGAYTYLLCWFREPDESQILIYDREGNMVFSKELTTYCQGTAGYIPREAEWEEELEGREDDFLLSMLFADGPNDSVMLEQCYDGQTTLTIIRKSPIDGERYCILCRIQEDFSIVPVMYYPVENEGGIPYGLPMVSPDAQYDLLSPQKDALYGINLEEGTLTALAGWTQLDTSPSWFWFSGWANSVAPGPDGRIWSVEWSRKADAYILRAIGPISS